MSIIKNRLVKNNKRLNKYFSKINVNAYRIYHHDIPEYPYFIDLYNGQVILHDRRMDNKDFTESKMANYQETLDAIRELYNVTPIIKKRREQKRQDKYQRIQFEENYSKINEDDLWLRVNLHDYIDTGVFLDHRPLRRRLKEEAKDKEVLNLFSYTCAISAACAFGAKKVTSVDLSQKYLDWGKENFRMNNIDPENHEFLSMDILENLTTMKRSFYDLIILDPPTFSNSKKMRSTLDIQRDHELLLSNCMQLLKKDGVLYFSTNNLKFKFSYSDPKVSVKNITHETLDEDFKNTRIHQSFCLRWKE